MNTLAQGAAPSVRRDRFGNAIDPTVGYARGAVITGEVAESIRQQRAYAIVRDRYKRFGDDGVFNLTGLIRAFPFEEGDAEAMRSYVHFIARSGGELEPLAIARMGGSAEKHDGFLATRITAATLATMLTVLKPGDRVVSLVAADRSHPSVRQGVVVAQGTFEEFTDIDAFEAAVAGGQAPRAIVITTISPSKNHLPKALVERAAAAARSRGALVILDDAHMAARISLHNEPGGLALADADLAVWSMDKHLGGPRSGFVAGKRELVQAVKARALSLGVEAQLGQYIAAAHAVAAFDPEPIREAARMSVGIRDALQSEAEGKMYLAGAGIAVGGEDYLELALLKSNHDTTSIVPIEAMAFVSMRILEELGGVMIPAVGMPGAACTFRIMCYPDGARFGMKRVVEAWRTGMNELVAAIDEPERIAGALLGASTAK